MNRAERENWVLNDEPLYGWFRGSGLSMSAFLKRHRETLDAAIKRRLDEKPHERTWRDIAQGVE